MSIVDTEEDNVVPIRNKLQLYSGGRDGGYNWLLEIPNETIFIAQKLDDKGFVLFCFRKQRRLGDSTVVELLTQESQHIFVDSERFSKQFDFKAGYENETDEDI